MIFDMKNFDFLHLPQKTELFDLKKNRFFKNICPTVVKSSVGTKNILKHLTLQYFDFPWGVIIESEKKLLSPRGELSTGGWQLEMSEKDKVVSARLSVTSKGHF